MTRTLNPTWRSHRCTAPVARRYGLLAAVTILTLCVAILGGSSRYDSAQLIGLQPIAWLVTAYFALMLRRGDFAGLIWPAGILFAFTLLLFLQLLPLPVAIWTALPGRGIVTDLDAVLGMKIARPLSLVPSRTINAFAGLSVPIAALFAFAVMRERRLHYVSCALLGVAFLNAFFSLVQTLGPGGEVLYFYHSVNKGAAVGLFANPNHAAVFGSVMMVFIACAISLQKPKERPAIMVPLYGLYAFVFVMSLVAGSRAGLLTNAAALLATTAILTQDSRISLRRDTASKTGLRKLSLTGIMTAIVGLSVALIFVMSDRLPAFASLVTEDPLGDLRFQVTPTLLEMAYTYFPVGSGIGSFESVYYIHETRALLQPAYLNMAHNDWLQFIIEAGLAGAAILIAAIVWKAYSVRQLLKVGKLSSAFGYCGITLIVAVASMFDYPLRTPLFQFVIVWLLLAASELARSEYMKTSDVGVPTKMKGATKMASGNAKLC